MKQSITAGEQFAQTLGLLNWLRTHPDGNLMQASQQLDIPVAQIKYELQQVSLCGLPGYFPGSLVDVFIDKTTARVQFSAGLDHPLTLTTMEAGVLLFSLEALRSTMPEEQQNSIRTVCQKIRSLLDSPRKTSHTSRDDAPSAVHHAQHMLTNEHSAHSSEHPQETPAEQHESNTTEHISLWQAISDAVRERRMVTCEYYSLSSDSIRPRKLNPDYIAIINGQAYLWAREEDQQRTFALHRMSHIAFDEPGSAPGQPLIPRVTPEDPFHFENADGWATLELSAEATWMLEYYPMWLVEGEGTPERPVVYMPYTNQWLERFCVGFGRDITVIEPLELAERVRQRAQAGLQAYSS